MLGNVCSLSGVSDDSEEESDEGAETRRDLDGITGPPLPRIVGLGLCSVFELIRETWIEQPSLCRRALKALLDMLQVSHLLTLESFCLGVPS